MSRLVEVRCAECGETFPRSAWEARRSRRHYCDGECSRKARSKLPDDEVLLRLRAEGKSLAQIGAAYGATRQAVHERLRALAPSKPAPSGRFAGLGEVELRRRWGPCPECTDRHAPWAPCYGGLDPDSFSGNEDDLF